MAGGYEAGTHFLWRDDKKRFHGFKLTWIRAKPFNFTFLFFFSHSAQTPGLVKVVDRFFVPSFEKLRVR